ncbi:unnamed protein product [Rotaria sordida]|uniref:Uncharacterized protein n=1 Tax=Rotaria sordida TaxID=392033 RepID=A0A814X9M5_9BILA|nr:unnamed protein product [Rotaria sordida]
MAERNQNLMILSTNEKSETSNNETQPLQQEHKKPPQLVTTLDFEKITNLELLGGGGASMELDRICEGFSNIINNINDIREGLSDEGTRYLFEEIKNNIAIIPPLTFLLPDKQEKKECKTDPTKAVCIACNVQFSIENSVLGDINRHIQRKKHQECVKSVESNRSKTVDTMFHIPTSDLQKLCAAEGTLVFHGIKHSHSYVSQACTVKLVKKCLLGSSITKNINCNRTKAREIACNVLAPSLTYALVLELRDVTFFSIAYDSSNRGNSKMLPIVILKHIRLRWLNLLPSIERLIVVHPVVKSYFLNLEHDECPNLLFKFFTSNEANVLPEVQVANLSLQREHTTGVN